MEGRLINAAEGMIFGLVFAGLAWVVAMLVRKTTGRKIDSGAYYGVAIVMGFLFRHALLVLLNEAST